MKQWLDKEKFRHDVGSFGDTLYVRDLAGGTFSWKYEEVQVKYNDPLSRGPGQSYRRKPQKKWFMSVPGNTRYDYRRKTRGASASTFKNTLLAARQFTEVKDLIERFCQALDIDYKVGDEDFTASKVFDFSVYFGNKAARGLVHLGMRLENVKAPLIVYTGRSVTQKPNGEMLAEFTRNLAPEKYEKLCVALEASKKSIEEIVEQLEKEGIEKFIHDSRGATAAKKFSIR
jgi:hypothetical protein